MYVYSWVEQCHRSPSTNPWSRDLTHLPMFGIFLLELRTLLTLLDLGYTVYRMLQQNLNVKCLEAGTAVGGTWYWNR